MYNTPGEMTKAFNQHDTFLAEAAEIKAKLFDQFGGVLTAVFEALGYNLNAWYVECAQDDRNWGEIGELKDVFTVNDLSNAMIDLSDLTIELDDDCSNEEDFVIIDGQELSMCECIMTRWLFMSHDDVRDEVKKGRAKYLRDRKKERVKTRKDERALLSSIKAKLTPEENNFLEKRIK